MMQLKRLCAVVALIVIVYVFLNNSVMALDYNSYVYTTDDIVIFSYENDIVFDIYNSDDIIIYDHVFDDPNGLDKGECVVLDDGFIKGVYRISSSSPEYSVLVGDATASNSGICGYYAMDSNGLGVSNEFYTYVPRYYVRHERLIVFAYEDDTAVTVETGNGNGSYTAVSSETIDDGERIVFENPNHFSNEYLHISADKPVSVLTAYDFGYLVPASNGKWSGRKFYTCVNNVTTMGFSDEQDLVVSAFDDNTFVTVTDTDTDELIWQGLVDAGKCYIKNFPFGWYDGPKFYTIESDKTVSVTVAGPDKIHHQLLADRNGTGIGNRNNEIVGPTRGNKTSLDNYIMVLGYRDNTPVDFYDTFSGELEDSVIVSAGKTRKITASQSQWKVVAGGPVSVYSGIDASARAEFVPLVFDVKRGLPYLSKTFEIENSAAAVNPTDPNANEITYTISYANPITNPADPNYIGTITDLQLADYLSYDSAVVSTSVQGTFDLLTYSYNWDIGTLSPGQSGSITFTAVISTDAAPMSTITNWAELSNDEYEVITKTQTPVACWGDETVYVKTDAKGRNDGTSWTNAYTSLYRAMDKVRACTNAAHNHAIWVAKGTYYTTHSSDSSASFDLIEGVNIYGGFSGDETSLMDRDWNENQCVLTGGIGGPDIAADSDYVVTAGSEITTDTELDGFTITRGVYAGIYALEGCPAIYNCNITANHGDGIYIDDAQATINLSSVYDNTYHGIYCDGTGSLNVDRCKIYGNDTGIDSVSFTSVIKNSWIHNNADNGIEVGSNATVRNNTILSNGSYGLYKTAPDTPTIKNTIIWDNGLQLLRGWEAEHCCVMNIDPNNFNINTDPGFAYTGYRDFHLAADSPCVDAGNSTGIVSELDLDNEDRIYGTSVDIGADEQTCEDVSNTMDFNADGIINLSEFAVFAAAWDSWAPGATGDPNDAINWNADCDFYPDDHIDTDDLIILADNWLWQACWRQQTLEPLGGMCMMAMPTQEPIEEGMDIAELEYTLFRLKTISLDPVWESQLGTQEWYNLIESLEAAVETMSTQ
jgi:hypothetical protein